MSTVLKHWNVHNLVHFRKGTDDTSETASMPRVSNKFLFWANSAEIGECFSMGTGFSSNIAESFLMFGLILIQKCLQTNPVGTILQLIYFLSTYFGQDVNDIIRIVPVVRCEFEV